MKKCITTLLYLCTAIITAQATIVDSTANVIVYYPEFSSVDLVCGQMPPTTDETVDFCCPAAFTGQLLDTFTHTNIADNHVSGGIYYKGYACDVNTGAFAWSAQGWSFMPKDQFFYNVSQYAMGFCQYLIIYNGEVMPRWKKLVNFSYRYRALCERGGRLCLVESKEVVTFDDFLAQLQAIGVTHALYLEMGAGWNYTFYRDLYGHIRERFPEAKTNKFFTYRTNWLTFYR